MTVTPERSTADADGPPVASAAMEEIRSVAERFEHASTLTIIRWAVHRFGPGLVLLSSFQDCVLIDLATRVEPQVVVAFLDTQYHFPETLEYVERVRRAYDLTCKCSAPPSFRTRGGVRTSTRVARAARCYRLTASYGMRETWHG